MTVLSILARPRGSGTASLDITGLTFVRATEASYLVSAPTTGGSPFLAWAPSGTLRQENRGDFLGVLLEKLSKNCLVASRDFTAGVWSVGTGTVTSPGVPGPDGGTAAQRIVCSLVQYGPFQQVTPVTVPACVSAWVRSNTGTGSVVSGYYDAVAPTSGVACNAAPGTTYQRIISAPGGVDNQFALPQNGIITTGVSGGLAAGARDAVVDLMQLEAGAYATSAVRTTVAAATRNADSLTGAAPAWVKTGTIHIAHVSPAFADTDLSNGDKRYVLTLDSASDGIYFDKTAGVVTVKVVAGGAVKATSGALAFAKQADLGALVIDVTARTVSVGGVAGSAGTAWDWSARTNLRIGGISGGSGSELDGRVSPTWTST